MQFNNSSRVLLIPQRVEIYLNTLFPLVHSSEIPSWHSLAVCVCMLQLQLYWHGMNEAHMHVRGNPGTLHSEAIHWRTPLRCGYIITCLLQMTTVCFFTMSCLDD